MTKSNSCTIKGCGRPVHCKKMCQAHYRRSRKRTAMNVPVVDKRSPRPGTWTDWRPDSQGYVRRYRSLGNGKNEWQTQHRVVMEESLGRKLTKGENVHHINGDRSDNRIENLELWSTSQPPGQRVKDKVAWAKNFLEQYGYRVESTPEVDSEAWQTASRKSGTPNLR